MSTSNLKSREDIAVPMGRRHWDLGHGYLCSCQKYPFIQDFILSPHLSVSMRDFPDGANEVKKTFPKCGRHHSLDWSLGLNKKKKVSYAPVLLPLCSLTVGTLCSCHHDYPQPVASNCESSKPFLPLVVLVRCSVRASGKVTNNLGVVHWVADSRPPPLHTA